MGSSNPRWGFVPLIFTLLFAACTNTSSLVGGATDAASDIGESDASGDVTCGTGQTACGGACVSIATDSQNCGACGRVCPKGCYTYAPA